MILRTTLPLVNARKRKPNPLRLDPSRTATLRRQFVAELRRRLARLRAAVLRLVVADDAFGLARRPAFGANASFAANVGPFAFRSDPEKVRAFKDWLRTQMRSDVLGEPGEAVWRRFIEDGFRRGAGRAFDDATRRDRALAQAGDRMDFYQGGRDRFLRSAFGRPVAEEKVQLLAGRVYTDLEGVTEDMATRMTRTLADGLVRGVSPRDLGRELAASVDGIGRRRAETIARTEVIRAHASGQLHALEALGVERIGVEVEWSATPDSITCPLCSEMDGTVYTLEEARGLIPAHPNCRCSFIPVPGSGEDAAEEDAPATDEADDEGIDE